MSGWVRIVGAWRTVRARIRTAYARSCTAYAWVVDQWGALCSFLCPLVLSVITTIVGFDDDRKKWLFENPKGIATTGVCSLLLICGTWGLVSSLRKTRSTNEQLAEARERLHADYTEMLDRQLYLLANRLQFTDRERISVYRKCNDVFVTLARYSQHPEFTLRGRKLYPAGEGMIARAWADGSSIELDLPDPDAREAEYRKAQLKRCGMTIDSLASIRMRSRAYGAFAVCDTSDTRRVAVVLFESLGTNLPVDRIRQQLIDGESRRIAEFIHTYKAFEPDVAYAQEEGF